MSGMAAFAGKETREILRTWRIWVLPGILLLFALTGPVLARFIRYLVGALAGDQLGGFKMPTPTYVDAYTQWVKNLSQSSVRADHHLREHHVIGEQERDGCPGAHQTGLAYRIRHRQGSGPLAVFCQVPGLMEALITRSAAARVRVVL